MSDTPRCDKKIEEMARERSAATTLDILMLARSLERELNTARTELANCRAHAGDFAADCFRLERELEKARRS